MWSLYALGKAEERSTRVGLASNYGDCFAGSSDGFARWLLRMVRAASRAHLMARECALYEQQRVHCTPPLESLITRPGPFMPCQWVEVFTHAGLHCSYSTTARAAMHGCNLSPATSC